MTYPDPAEWIAEVGHYSGEPLLQRFDWGIPAPSTWLVAYRDADDFLDSKEFASREEAEAFAAEQSTLAKARGDQ
jgi:hypothetical protein